MTRQFLLWTYVVVVLALVSASKTVLAQHEFHAPLDEDLNYLLDWTYDNAQQIMTFTVKVKTTGWIGFGISPYTGQMPGSDVVIAWVDSNGKAHLQDRFAEGRSLPGLDMIQDYKLISGTESNGITTIKFSRKFNTEDPKDLLLDTGTTRLIWAYHSQDPPTPYNIPIHQKKGSRSLNLFERMPEGHKPSLPSDVQTHDCRVPNATVPAKKTTYWCVGMRLPQVTEPNHIVKIEPLIDRANAGLVHHMILYECDANDKWHDYSDECESENMPMALRYCRGGAIVAGWGVGGESITFPTDTGFPIGNKNDPKFTIIEMHYDNPDQKSDIVDQSGFRLYYTKKLRKHDIGVLTVGHLITLTMAIPERQSRWNITGYCPQYCTERGIFKTGVNIFGVFFHTHLAGIALSTRHFRGGKELPMLAENKHYDFNYQEVVYLKRTQKFMPGDSLALTCSYQTKNRNNLTIGGLETTDEMCFSYLFYYPRAPLAACASYTGFETLTPYFTKLTQMGKMPLPTRNGSRGIAEALQKTTLADQNLIKELKYLQTYPAPSMYCSYLNKSLVTPGFNVKIPNFVAAANFTGPIVDTSTSTSGVAPSMSSVHAMVTLLFTIIVVALMV